MATGEQDTLSWMLFPGPSEWRNPESSTISSELSTEFFRATFPMISRSICEPAAEAPLHPHPARKPLLEARQTKVKVGDTMRARFPAAVGAILAIASGSPELRAQHEGHTAEPHTTVPPDMKRS